MLARFDVAGIEKCGYAKTAQRVMQRDRGVAAGLAGLRKRIPDVASNRACARAFLSEHRPTGSRSMTIGGHIEPRRLLQVWFDTVRSGRIDAGRVRTVINSPFSRCTRVEESHNSRPELGNCREYGNAFARDPSYTNSSERPADCTNEHA